MSNPAITTEIGAWLDTGRHANPIDSAALHVCVGLIVNGVRVANGFASRPFREMPYVTTDQELQETEFWKSVVAEAHDQALQDAKSIMAALAEPAA